MIQENQENAPIPIQQIFVTWSNGAKGVFSGPAVLTPEEMSELNVSMPKITSVKVSKPFVLQGKKHDKEKKDI